MKTPLVQSLIGPDAAEGPDSEPMDVTLRGATPYLGLSVPFSSLLTFAVLSTSPELADLRSRHAVRVKLCFHC